MENKRFSFGRFSRLSRNAGCALAAAGTASMLLASCTEKEKKNVLFIMVDDMKPSIGCFGDPFALTPYMDSLASESVVYTRAYCQQALSGPSRASILTGLRPDDNGVTELNTWIRKRNPEVVTLPQAFRQAGYRTVSVGKTFHGEKNTLDSLSWSQKPLLYKYSKNDEYCLPENRTGKKAASHEFTSGSEDWFLDMKIREEAVSQIRQLAGDGRPFFLAVGFLKPHLPFCAPKRFLEMYEGRDMGTFDRNRIEGAPLLAYHDSDELRGYTDIGKGTITPEKDMMLKRAYYACTSFADENIGAVISALKASGQYDNTVIVVLGDHGYHTGEQELWCKSTNYEQACRAPLIIREPGCRKGRKVEYPVEFVDIFPTLASMCGVSVPDNLAGKNLTVPVPEERRFAVSQFPRPYRALHNKGARTHMGYTVRDGRWRYVEWYDNAGVLAGKELYDMDESLLESRNLSGDSLHSGIERRLSATLAPYVHK